MITYQQFFLYVIILGVMFSAYNAHKAKSKVYCTFIRRDNTIGHKWAKAKNGERIEFEGGWYYVVTKCMTSEPMTSGFNMIWPTMVRCLEFSWKGGGFPNDPMTGEVVDVTPEMRKNLDKREDIEAVTKGTQTAMSKGKVPMLGGGLLPIILVIGLVACFYFIWQLNGKVDMVGNGQNVIEGMLGKIMQSLPVR